MAAPGKVRFGRFEFQVRLVLVLLVLFLATLDLMNLFLLNHARDELAGSEFRAAVERSAGFADWIGRDALLNAARVGRGVGRVTNGSLRRGARERAFDRVALLDVVGATIAESGPARASAQARALGAEDREELAAGRPAGGHLRPRRGGPDAQLIVFQPLLDNQGRLAGILETATPVPGLGRLVERLRLVIVVQAVAVLTIGVLVLLFANWVSRPLRRIADVAESVGLGGGEGGDGVDPERLADAFRGVAHKLQAQEEALAELGGSGGLAGLRRFAATGAEGMSTGVLVLDAEARVVALNPAAAALLARDADAIQDAELAEVARGVSGLDELVTRCLADGRGASREVLESRADDGSHGHVGVALSPATGAAGAIEGVLVLMTDLTEIRRIQKHDRLRENMVQVGRLSAGIAHEFRNALGTILGYAKRLAKRDDPTVAVPAGEIVREVQSVRASIDEFLLYARPPEPTRDPVDVETVVCACAAGAEGLDVRIDGEFGTVHADEDLLRRAFRNLLQNAADAGREAGRAIRVGIRGTLEAGTLRIDVDDNGPGIAEENAERIFEPFFTTRPRGTGIGLALVQRTFVDLGGTIEAGNGPLGGARFRIRLPRIGAERAKREAM